MVSGLYISSSSFCSVLAAGPISQGGIESMKLSCSNFLFNLPARFLVAKVS